MIASSPTRRIVLVSGHYPPRRGGVSDYSGHLVQALRDAGLDVVVVTGARGPASGDEPESVVDIAEHGLSWGLRDAPAVSALVASLRPSAVSVQYVPHMYGPAGVAPGMAVLPTLIRRRCRCAVLCTLHELGTAFAGPPRARLLAAVHRLQLLAVLRPASRAIISNPWDGTRLRRLFPADRVHHLPIGSTIAVSPLSEAERRSTRESLAIDPEALVLADFSPYSWAKNPEVLAAVLEALPQGHLLLIGGIHGSPTLRDRFWKAASKLRRRITELPELDAAAVSRYLQAADIYLHTSVTAGASQRSTTLASALSHGLPAVAFSGRETPAGFLEEAGLRLVLPRKEPSPWSAFVEAVLDLARSPERRALAAAAARDLYQRRLSWPRIAAGYLDLIAA